MELIYRETNARCCGLQSVGLPWRGKIQKYTVADLPLCGSTIFPGEATFTAYCPDCLSQKLERLQHNVAEWEDFRAVLTDRINQYHDRNAEIGAFQKKLVAQGGCRFWILDEDDFRVAEPGDNPSSMVYGYEFAGRVIKPGPPK